MTDQSSTTSGSAASANRSGSTGQDSSTGGLAEENSRLRATLQKIEARANEIRRWSAGRQEAARDIVEERPLAVVGAAFGVGLLLGLVASRV